MLLCPFNVDTSTGSFCLLKFNVDIALKSRLETVGFKLLIKHLELYLSNKRTFQNLSSLWKGFTVLPLKSVGKIKQFLNFKRIIAVVAS